MKVVPAKATLENVKERTSRLQDGRILLVGLYGVPEPRQVGPNIVNPETHAQDSMRWYLLCTRLWRSTAFSYCFWRLTRLSASLEKYSRGMAVLCDRSDKPMQSNQAEAENYLAYKHALGGAPSEPTTAFCIVGWRPLGGDPASFAVPHQRRGMLMQATAGAGCL